MATYVKSGWVVMGTAAGFGFVKQGATTAEFTGSGLDAIVFAEEGQVWMGDANPVISIQKTGTAVSAFTASGPDEKTSVETGAGVSALVASGQDVETSAEAGTAVLEFLGPPLVEEDEGGVTRQMIFTKTGAGVSAFTGSGTDAKTSIETGRAVMGAVLGTGYVKTGAGVSAFVGSGVDATVFSEASDGLEFPEPPSLDSENPAQLTMVASGAKVMTTGAGGITYTKAGTAISVRTAANDGRVTYAEAGTGILVRVSSGSKTFTPGGGGTTFSKTGITVRGHSGSGADATTFTRAGGGFGALGVNYGSGAYGFGPYGTWGGSSRIGSGTKSVSSSETGLASSEREAFGEKTVTYVEAGLVVSVHTGSGTKQYVPSIVYVKTGIAIMERSARGVSAGSHRWLSPHDSTTIVLTTMVATSILLTPKPEEVH